MEINKPAEIERVKEILTKIDPKVAMMAILRSEVNSDEVNEIKKELSKYKRTSIKRAVEELDHEYVIKEVNKVGNQLASFDKEIVVAALGDLGFDLNSIGYCIDSITCRSNCVMVMGFSDDGCVQVMSPQFGEGIDEIISPFRYKDIAKTRKIE